MVKCPSPSAEARTVSSNVGTGMAGRMRGDEGRDLEAEVVGTNLDPRMAAWKRKEKKRL